MKEKREHIPPVSDLLRITELATSTVPLILGGRLEPVVSKKYRSKPGGIAKSYSMLLIEGTKKESQLK